MLEWMERPHRRLNPLSGEWVVVSPQRALRPWQGEIEPAEQSAAIAYDPHCYLCPGNERAGGVRNPHYTSTFIFDNDFPALIPTAQSESLNENALLVAASEAGVCRVMCFSPRHDLAVPSMDLNALGLVVEAWCTESAALRNLPFVEYVQIFENRGAMMGASNPHPHCQMWAVEHIPNDLAKEDNKQGEYAAKSGGCLLCDYARLEEQRERLICENTSFLALVPFWAVWPFEILVIPKRHCARLDQTTGLERHHLAALLREVTRRFDGVFDAPFPYSMGFHEQPKHATATDGMWHLHAHYYPPLLRSAIVRKFMVGFELLAGPQRDITPEMAALRLRRVSLPLLSS